MSWDLFYKFLYRCAEGKVLIIDNYLFSQKKKKNRFSKTWKPRWDKKNPGL